MNSSVGSFFHLWPHLKTFKRSEFKNFIMSLSKKIHQEHARVFLTIYCADILNYVKGINLRKFLNLIVKLVVDYQDLRLISRKYTPGKQNIWAQADRFAQYNTPSGNNRIVRGAQDNDRLVSWGDRYENKLLKYRWNAYEEVISELSFIDKVSRY